MEVDAIEDGRIVRVSEQYARMEGLMIIRKKIETAPEVKSVPLVQLRRAERRSKPLLDEFRRPLDYRKNNVIQELKENFQWDITRKRREKNITRMKLALIAGVSEDDIISLEHGLLPSDNFVLINKVEAILGIKLKKEQAKQEMQTAEQQKSQEPETKKENSESHNPLAGNEIQLE